MNWFKYIVSFLIVIFIVNLSAQWSEDPQINTPVAILENSQAIPKIGISSTGDVYIGFFSYGAGSYNVRLQRYDSWGNPLWESNGILISDNPSMSWLTDWDMEVDQSNNAILAFQDVRTGSNDIHAYSISEDGQFNWGDNGLQLSATPEFDADPKICITTDNNAVIAWSAEDNVRMNKISPEGSLLWGDTGISVAGDLAYSSPQPLAIDNDEIILGYYEETGNFPALTRYILTQRYDTNGNSVWVEPAVATNAGGISSFTDLLPLINDGANGCFLSWHDDRDSDMDAEGYVQHIDQDGTVLWSEDGVSVITTDNRETYNPNLIYDPIADQLTAFWRSTDSNQNNFGITGQKIDSAGDLLWSDNGLTLISLSPVDIFMFGVSSSPYGNIILYEDSADYFNSNTKAMLLDENGGFVWEQEIVTLCSVESQKLHPAASQFANGQWVAVWEDTRDDNGDIYAQNVTYYGELGPVQTTAGISGSVIIYEGEGNVEDVVVSAGSESTNPNAEGNYTLILDPGIYNVSASLNGYVTVTEEGVEVEDETITDNVNFLLELEEFVPPYNVEIDALEGILSWEHPYVTGEETEEGFELEELPDNWLNIDSDGDTLSWFLYEYSPQGGSQSIASASWISPIGALNPDNWLISPALEIGTDSELHFWYAAQDGSYPNEHFTVYLSTGGTELSDFTENIFEITVDSNEWTEAVIDLNAYLDETVHLAWRHYDCTDQFYLKLDDISLVNAETRENILLADFEAGEIRDNLINNRDSRFREVESYNIYLDGELITNTTDFTYTFQGLLNGQLYEAGVSAVYTFGESDPVELEFTYEGTDASDDLVDTGSYLIGNYPNPFNPVTQIEFSLTGKDARVAKLEIFNIKGQKIKAFYAPFDSALGDSNGLKTLTWDGSDDSGQPVTSGLYYYRLITEESSDVKKMILLK